MPVVTNAAWTDLGSETNDRAMQPRGGDVYLASGANPAAVIPLEVFNGKPVVLPGGTQYQVRAIDQAAVSVGVIDYGS